MSYRGLANSPENAHGEKGKEKTALLHADISLADVTFVVVDLETTGGRPGAEAITEIGAVKVRGGEIRGEFATLVDPGQPIPPSVEHLTGITTSMTRAAPRISSVLPSFLEFVGQESVLVAHNARFDMSFLSAAAHGQGLGWSPRYVVDTLALARGLVSAEEVSDHKLSTLAKIFNSETTPTHRALDDARATTEVLHGLLERAGALGMINLHDLIAYSSRVPDRHRRKAALTANLPAAPGVYLLRDSEGVVVHIGHGENVRQTARRNFTDPNQPRRMREMIDLVSSVDVVPCATRLEAEIMEQRLLAQNRPSLRVSSPRPPASVWLRFRPRTSALSITRKVPPRTETVVGPFTSTRHAKLAAVGISHIVALREASLSDLFICDQILTRVGRWVDELDSLVADLKAQDRFHEARHAKAALMALLDGVDRAQRHASLRAVATLIAARPSATGGWEFILVRSGEFVASAHARRGQDPVPALGRLKAAITTVGAPSAPPTRVTETDLLLHWLERPGTRLVECSNAWMSAIDSARSHLSFALSSPQHEKAAQEQSHPTTRDPLPATG